MRSKLGLLVASLLTIPLISAYTWGYGSPFDYFNNEWIKFTAVLVVLFAIIYYFVKKKTDNTPVSTIVGLGIALLLTIALMKRGILDNFLEESIVDWVLIIAIIFVIFFLFYRFAFKEDMYGYRRFSLWRFVFVLVLIALIPLFIDLEQVLPDALMYGPFLDFVELLQGFSSFIFIGLGIVIIIWILWKIKNLFSGRRRYGRGWGRGRARRPSWRDRKAIQQPQRHRRFRHAYREAKTINRQAEQRANRADWARREHRRQQAVAGKWKSKGMIVQKRDAEKQAARQAREQAQRQAEQERTQRIYAKQQEKAQAMKQREVQQQKFREMKLQAKQAEKQTELERRRQKQAQAEQERTQRIYTKQQEKAKAIAEKRTRREQEKTRIIAQKQRGKETLIQKKQAEKERARQVKLQARQAKEQAQKQAEQERTQRIYAKQQEKARVIAEERRKKEIKKAEISAYKENERRRNKRLKKKERLLIKQGKEKDKKARREYTQRQKPKNKWPRQEAWRNQNIKEYIEKNKEISRNIRRKKSKLEGELKALNKKRKENPLNPDIRKAEIEIKKRLNNL